MAITIAAETPLQDDVRRLVEALNAAMMPLTPRQYQFQMSVERMAGPGMTTLVARDEAGRAIGTASFKEYDDALGEVKRMFADPSRRGEGLGFALLAQIERLAREKGIKRLVLETGEAEGFAPAYRRYEGSGFTRCGRFLDYPDSGHNRFYEKNLAS